MQFNFESDTPIYIQVAKQIKDAILSGAFPEETQIPSTTEVSVTYKINPATALRGVTLLVDAGILYKKRGVGIFVQKGAAEKILNQRKDAFYNGYIIRSLEEAKKLHISRQEIIRMIEEGITDGSGH